MKTVLIINGNPQSGKTTFSEMIAEERKAIIYSSITTVKDIYTDYFGWSGVKNDETRKFLSDMKAFLNAKTDILERDLEDMYEHFGYSYAEILMIDIREIDEIEKYKRWFHAKTVFIDNPHTQTLSTNVSDAQVANYEYDYVIDNFWDLAELKNAAREFLIDLERDSQPKLYFRNNREQDIYISEVTDMKDVDDKIKKFLEVRKYASYYTRFWSSVDGNIIIDVGSHSEFFVVKGMKNIFK